MPSDEGALIDRRSTAAKLTARIASQFVSTPLSLIGGVIVARMLGPGGKGQFSIILTSYNVLCEVALMGMGTSILYHIARQRLSPTKVSQRAIAICLTAFAIPFAVLFGVRHRAVPLLQLSTENEPLLWLMLLSVPLTAMVAIAGGLIRARDHLVELSFLVFLSYLLNFRGLLVAVYLLRLGLAGAVGASIVVAGVMALTYWCIAVPAYVREGPSESTDVPLRSLLLYGLWAQLAALGFILVTRGDTYILNHLRGNAAVGVYSVSMSGAEFVTPLGLHIGYVMTSRVALAGREEAGASAATAHRFALWGSLLIALLMLPVSYFLVPNLYGRAFAPAILPLWMCLPGHVLLAAANSGPTAYLVARGGAAYSALSYFVAGAVMIALDFPFIRMWGVAGAALAYTIAWACHYALTTSVAWWKMRVTVRVLFMPQREDLQRVRAALSGVRLPRFGR